MPFVQGDYSNAGLRFIDEGSDQVVRGSFRLTQGGLYRHRCREVHNGGINFYVLYIRGRSRRGHCGDTGVWLVLANQVQNVHCQ